MTFQNNSANTHAQLAPSNDCEDQTRTLSSLQAMTVKTNAHAQLAPNNDCEDHLGIPPVEDHFMSVPLVACILWYSFFIIPIHTFLVLSLSRTIRLYLSHTLDYQFSTGYWAPCTLVNKSILVGLLLHHVSC
jgi:hypothetical protein